MTVPTLVSALPGVGLDELNERAALTTRRDRKYLVPLDRVPDLIEAVSPGGRVLEIDGRRSFRYRTHYFDSDDLQAYRDTARRRPVRRKIRTRRYLDSGEHWLELKQRTRTGITEKHRWPIDGGAADLDAVARAHLAEVLGDDAAAEPVEEHLTTSFERTTILLEDDARLTIDTDVAFAIPGQREPRHLRHAIVETKTTGKPCIADRTLWAMRIRPTKVSKYGTGLAALRPELPSNRWARLLRSDAWAD